MEKIFLKILAFGEIGVKTRVKAVLNYHKPAFWLVIAAVLACIAVAVCFLTNPRQDTYQVKIVIPAGSTRDEITYSEEEISPFGDRIVLSAGDGLGDTEVVLFPMEWEEDRAYEPAYLTPGMPVKMEAEKGAWFRIGIRADNPTKEDRVVYVRAKGVDIRIVDKIAPAVIPMVMVNDKYYYDTGRESGRADRSPDIDGEITSTVEGTEKPAKNNQSNFGAGYVYQFGENDTIEVQIDEKWIIFEYRSGDGSLIRFGDHWYSAGDLSTQTIEWLQWYNSLSEEEQLAVSYVPWDLQHMEGVEAEETEDTAKAQEGEADALEEAISREILKKNEGAYADSYDLACCDFAALGTEAASDALAEDGTETVTCYGWAMYQEYRITEQGLENVGGSYVPAALTFEHKGNAYTLTEYWEPRDGSYFVSDVRSKFPRFDPQMTEDAIDSQKFVLEQTQRCYRQAVEFSDLDTDRTVKRLLNTICDSPAASSNPGDYVKEHAIEYRELLYYGEYTLRYCLNRFRQGNETGLEGRMMALVCEELLQTKGSIPADAGTAETGQLWYEILYAHGSNQVEPYLE